MIQTEFMEKNCGSFSTVRHGIWDADPKFQFHRYSFGCLKLLALFFLFHFSTYISEIIVFRRSTHTNFNTTCTNYRLFKNE